MPSFWDNTQLVLSIGSVVAAQLVRCLLREVHFQSHIVDAKSISRHRSLFLWIVTLKVCILTVLRDHLKYASYLGSETNRVSPLFCGAYRFLGLALLQPCHFYLFCAVLLDTSELYDSSHSQGSVTVVPDSTPDNPRNRHALRVHRSHESKRALSALVSLFGSSAAFAYLVLSRANTSQDQDQVHCAEPFLVKAFELAHFALCCVLAMLASFILRSKKRKQRTREQTSAVCRICNAFSDQELGLGLLAFPALTLVLGFSLLRLSEGTPYRGTVQIGSWLAWNACIVKLHVLFEDVEGNMRTLIRSMVNRQSTRMLLMRNSILSHSPKLGTLFSVGSDGKLQMVKEEPNPLNRFPETDDDESNYQKVIFKSQAPVAVIE